MTAISLCKTTSFYLPPLDTDPHHLAIADRLQFGDADLDPRGIEVLEDDLCDVFGQRFHQGEMPLAQHVLEMLRDIGIIQRVFDVVAEAGAAVGQRDVEVDLQGLRHDLFTFVYADERGYLEFAQKYDIHVNNLLCLSIASLRARSFLAYLLDMSSSFAVRRLELERLVTVNGCLLLLSVKSA